MQFIAILLQYYSIFLTSSRDLCDEPKSQRWQLNGRLLWWTCDTCSFKLLFDLNVLPQVSQLKGLTFSWVCKICFSREYFDMRIFPHLSHGVGSVFHSLFFFWKKVDFSKVNKTKNKIFKCHQLTTGKTLLGSGCWNVLWEDNPDFCENAFPPIEIKKKRVFFREIASYSRLNIINLHLSQTYGFFFWWTATMWSVKFHFSKKLLPHKLHKCFRSLWCNLEELKV